MLNAKLAVFLSATLGNMTELNLANFEDLYDGIIKDRGSSALWFYPAAVSIYLPLLSILLANVQTGINYPCSSANVTHKGITSR